MIEPPSDLPDKTLLACLRVDFGLPIDRLTFLPLGHDAQAWVYRGDASEGDSYFVKVRVAINNKAGLFVPHHLAGLGVQGMVAPLAASGGRPWAQAARYAVIVYPFVAGATAMGIGMSDAQWRRYGELVRAVHEAPLTRTPALASMLRREKFEADGSAAVQRIDAHIADRHFDNPHQEAVAAYWRTNRTTVRRVLAASVDLGRAFALDDPPLVLCHADIHTNNVLVDEDGTLWIVDWDEAMVAPRERDLMFVIGGIHDSFVKDRQTQLFLQGYGDVETSETGLTYYRCAWAIGDIGAYGEQVFYRPDLGATSVAEAATRFLGLFEPGSIVDIALRSRLAS